MIYGFDGAYSNSCLTQETCRLGTKARKNKGTLILLIIQRKWVVRMWKEPLAAATKAVNYHFLLNTLSFLQWTVTYIQVKLTEHLVMNTHTRPHRDIHTQEYMFEQLTGFYLAAAAGSKRMCQKCSVIIHTSDLLSFNPSLKSSFLKSSHTEKTYGKHISTID